ncbi:MAG: DUF4870 domain-containing protein [Bacteroidota bacterium]
MEQEELLDDIPNDDDYYPTPEERQWATLSHLGIITTFIIPFGNIVPALVIWLVKREDSPYVDYHAKEALNFQITIAIMAIISFVMIFLLIGIFLLLALAIISLIFCIVAAVQTNNGEYYEYPLNFRLIK